MANLRADYWQAGALSLHTFAVHLDVTPSRVITGRKGTNPNPVGLDGDTHKDKPVGPSTRLLKGWISDRDADGGLAATAALRIAQTEANIDALYVALYAAGGQVTITKRRLELDGIGGTTVEVYTAAAELLTFDVSYDGTIPRDQGAVAAWTAELHQADPWWYDDTPAKAHLG